MVPKVILVVERRGKIMCNCNCEHPDRKPTEGNCTEVQIKICHGDDQKNHPCDKEEAK